MHDPIVGHAPARSRISGHAPGWGGARAGAGAPRGPRASRIAHEARTIELARALVRPEAFAGLTQADIFHLAALSLMATGEVFLAGNLFGRAERFWRRRDRNSLAARSRRNKSGRAARVATGPPLS